METVEQGVTTEPENDKEATAILEQIEEARKSAKWRFELRQANSKLENSRPEEVELRKLDSSLKKNTAFVRKIKTFTESQKSSILKDISGLNLTKYIGEVAAAVTEAKIKMSDVSSFVEICSVMHQKYAEFGPSLLESWKKLLGKGSLSNPSKLRVDIRFYCDLICTGILTPKESLPVLGGLLTTLTGNADDLSHIGIILTFCRYCGEDFAGLVPRKWKLQGYEPDSEKFLPPEKAKNVLHLLKDYYACLTKKHANDFKELKSVEKTNYKILMTKGEVHMERKHKLEAMTVAFKKLQGHMEQLADLLDEDVPIVQDETESETPTKGIDGEDNDAETEDSNTDGLGSLWEDEDTKSFYEILIDLQEICPAILFKESKGQQGQVKPVVEEDLDIEADVDPSSMEIAEEPNPPIIDDDVDDTETGVNVSAKMMFDAFLAKIPNCVNREMIDSAATEFCMQFNTKNNRKKLVKSLYSVHRNRQDLLPFYGRFVATLNPCMPDIAVQLGQYLKQEFRWQLRKKDQMKIESKLKVCRFIGELVKFRLMPKSEILFCLKQLLFDFSHHHIEMACTILDSCGRFLLRSPDSHQRTKIYLDQMMRKKVAMTLDPRYIMMIDNAYYAVNPPISEASGPRQKSLTPIQAYIEMLIYNDLAGHNTEKVLKQIRRMHWDDPNETAFIVQTLGSVWNYKFINIRYGASLIAGLVSYHDWVGVQVVDDTLEHVRIGLELNDQKYNQKRLAVAKFLGELYNYRLIDSSVVFKVLYSLLTYGLDPVENVNYLDNPEDMIRIRLICTILDTCGAYFVSGSSKTKLKYFLAYFQQYYWRKRNHPLWNSEEDERPFPFEIANFVEETLKTLRPKIAPHKSLEESDKEVKKIEDEMVKVITGKAPELAKSLLKNQKSLDGNTHGLEAITEETQEETDNDSEDDSDDDEEDEEDEEEEEGNESLRKHKYDQEEDLEYDEEEEGNDDMNDDSQEVYVQHATKLIKCEEDDEFVNMFDKMMNETLNENKAAVPRSLQMDIVAPVHLRQHKKPFSSIEEANSFEDSSTMQFAVLLRKGAKQTLKEVAVPKDSDMAVNLLKSEQAQRLEKERMKKLTLEINERQEEEDLNEAIAMMQRPGLVSVNRDPRRPRAVPHKGVPNNVDAIFGNKRTSYNH